jgi:prolyl oligopeptidase
MASLKKMTKYPAAPRVDQADTLHGIRVHDPYRWLEDIDSAQTQEWIAAQNQLTSDYFDGLAFRGSILRRLTELWDYEKNTVPVKHGGRYFFTSNDGLQNQNVLYWMASLADEPRVLLDPNALSDDGTIALTGYAVSDDGTTIACGLSKAGSDWQEWFVRDVDSGIDTQDRLQWVKFSGASWTKDGKGLFYSRYDAPSDGLAFKGANYHHKLYYHRLGTAQSEDELIYARPDHKEWGFGGTVTEDGRFLIINVWQGTHRENGLFYVDLESGRSRVVELLDDFDAPYDFIGNVGSVLFIHTDLDAPLSRVIAIDIAKPERENWIEVIPESKDVLRSVTMVGDVLIALYLSDAKSRVQVWSTDGKPVREVGLPGPGTVEGFTGRYGDPETFYLYSSFTTPGTVFRYDVSTDDTSVFRQPDVAFDASLYTTRQVFYTSKDGTRIPMFISHRKGLVLDGHNPTYLYGYGGFDIPLTPSFSVSHLVWMEMGGVFAQANLRGGGEYGKAWHEAGSKLNKQNVFDDFIAAAEWLIEERYTTTSRLAIGGRSNGGLLVGACLTQRPDLFGACVPVVGVLDMLRFHEFTIGWAWTSDYGSPDDKDEFEALLAYSPYHNVGTGTAYPSTLIATGDHDDRVFPAHSFKFAAALQAAQTGPAPILIRIETEAGHGVGKPTTKLISEATDLWAFLVASLGMEVGGG